MADLALERRMLIDDTRRDARGDKVFKVLPWQSVIYTNGANEKIAGLEPVSANVSGVVLDNGTDMQIRGIEFVNEGTLFTRNSTAGHTSIPTG